MQGFIIQLVFEVLTWIVFIPKSFLPTYYLYLEAPETIYSDQRKSIIKKIIGALSLIFAVLGYFFFIHHFDLIRQIKAQYELSFLIIILILLPINGLLWSNIFQFYFMKTNDAYREWADEIITNLEPSRRNF